MEEEVNPYVKLTQTPLAQDTKCCGIRGGVAITIVGSLAIICSVIPGFFYAWFVGNEWDDIYPNEKHRDSLKGPKISCIAMLAGISVIHLIMSILVIVGGITLNTKFIYIWFSSFSFLMFIGRIGPICLLFKFDYPRVPLYLLIQILIDLITLGLMAKSAMHMTIEARNVRLLRTQFGGVQVKINPQSEAQANLLPAGSYPRM